jgi:hypothetical protein
MLLNCQIIINIISIENPIESHENKILRGKGEMDSSVHYNSYKKAILILQSIQASIGVIGIVCNMLTFMIFLRRPLRTHSYAIYFWIMSWADSFELLHMLRHWARATLYSGFYVYLAASIDPFRSTHSSGLSGLF